MKRLTTSVAVVVLHYHHKNDCERAIELVKKSSDARIHTVPKWVGFHSDLSHPGRAFSRFWSLTV